MTVNDWSLHWMWSLAKTPQVEDTSLDSSLPVTQETRSYCHAYFCSNNNVVRCWSCRKYCADFKKYIILLQWWSPRGHVLGLEGPCGHIFKSLALASWLMSLVLALRVRSLALWNFQWNRCTDTAAKKVLMILAKTVISVSSFPSCRDVTTLVVRFCHKSGVPAELSGMMSLHRERSPWHRLLGLCCMSLALALPSVSLTPSLILSYL